MLKACGDIMSGASNNKAMKERALEIFQRQKAAGRRQPFLSLKERRRTLWKLENLLLQNQDAIAHAIRRDFGHRSVHETRLLEIFPAVSGLSDARRRLRKWMKPRRRHVSLLFPGAANRVIPQPKGVVGIVSPWNYPLLLVLGPLTCALAAGNRCMVKMAAHSQGLCRLLRDLIGREIAEDLIAILPDVPGSDFTALPFDHLVFTGSPASGKTVMAAAARHLTPVTLELGGKSPAIILDDFDLKKAAQRILYFKCCNAGQTCLAPDYLFLPEDRLQTFTAAAREVVERLYAELETDDYTGIISEAAFSRLRGLLEDAREKGGRPIGLLPDAAPDEKQRKIPPTLVLDVTEDMQLMQSEIFGPILPVKTFRELDEVMDYINARPHPLAIYMFTNHKPSRRRLLYNTLSGGVCINDCAVHVAQHDLPFGGVGNSGMGQYHGREGFLEFSKLRPVFRQAPLASTAFVYPPYGRRFDRFFTLMTRLRRW